MANQIKAIVSVPGWANDLHEGEEKGVDAITNTSLAYAYVPLIFRAVRIRCDALIRPRVVLKNKAGTEVPWMFTVDPKDLIWKSEAALLLEGANFVEKLTKKMSKKTADLKWVNPTTMKKPKVTVGEKDKKLVYTFEQKEGTGKWSLDDMVYMREFSITDDTAPGVSAAGVALNDAKLLRFMNRSVTRFFETGMMPVTLLQVENLTDEDERKRIEGFFRRIATGIRNMWKVLALSRQVEAKVISQPLKDMVIPELNVQAKQNVAHAFGFNPSLLDQDPNRATAMEHRLALYQDTVEPRGEWLTEQFNRQVFAPLGLTMTLDYSNLDIYQEDETDRANSLSALTNAISTDPKAAFFAMTEILGYDLTEEQQKKYQDVFLSDPEPEQPEPAANTDPQEQDLVKWRKKALKQLEKKGSPICDFVSEHIDSDLHARISAGLSGCTSEDQVKRLFDNAGRVQSDVEALLEGIRLEVAAISKLGAS